LFPNRPPSRYAFPTDTVRIEQEQEEKAKLEIQNLVPAKYSRRYQLQTIVRTGTIDTELLTIVRDEAVDLVVMGTHGRRNFSRWFLGSVTERMLRGCPSLS
jgi:nucleotide-binding universal stress UspA family protein